MYRRQTRSRLPFPLSLSQSFHRTGDMQALRRLLPFSSSSPPAISSSAAVIAHALDSPKPPSFSSAATGDDEWNDAWETAWLPDDLAANNRAPWETDVHFPNSGELDADTNAFVAEMDERWTERRGAKQQHQKDPVKPAVAGQSELKSGVEYRERKQRIHAGLWMKEIEKMEESRLGGPAVDDIDRLLDSCSEIFDSGNTELNDKIPGFSDFKTKPDGWETTSKSQDGSIWEISQREEDILLQEFERRIAFSKFQIASFIKTHIFSRRRPIDGWKYMIEELGPNARKGKGSVQRLPTLSDPSTQPFREEKAALGSHLTSFRGR